MMIVSDKQRKAMFANMNNQFAGISFRQRAEMQPGYIKGPTEPATILGMYQPELSGRISRQNYPHFSLEEWQDLPSTDLPSLEHVKRYLQWLDMQQQTKEFHKNTIKPLLDALKGRPADEEKILRKKILALEQIPMAVPKEFRRKAIGRKDFNFDIDKQGNLILIRDIPESSVMPYGGEPIIRKKYVPELVEKLERTGKLENFPGDIERLKRVK